MYFEYPKPQCVHRYAFISTSISYINLAFYLFNILFGYKCTVDVSLIMKMYLVVFSESLSLLWIEISGQTSHNTPHLAILKWIFRQLERAFYWSRWKCNDNIERQAYILLLSVCSPERILRYRLNTTLKLFNFSWFKKVF